MFFRHIFYIAFSLLFAFKSCLTDGASSTETKIQKDETLIVRLPAKSISKYSAYRDVSLLHFNIPADTKSATFKFKAYEEPKRSFQSKCPPNDITLHLKAGSYPVISPENITFPRTFLNLEQRHQTYNLQFESNAIHQILTIDGPQIGNWFAITFISWTDPNNERIEQQGLARSCKTQLSADMSVVKFTPTQINFGQTLIGTLKSPEPKNVTSTLNTTAANSNSNIIYKFFVPENIGTCIVKLSILIECSQCPDVGLYVQSNALPSNDNYLSNKIIRPNTTGQIEFEINVHANLWHYIVLKFENPDPEESFALEYNFEINLPSLEDIFVEDKPDIISQVQPYKFRDMEFYPLLRQGYRDFFMFEYDFVPDVNGSIPSTLNLTANTPSGFHFPIGDIYDIGGTLSFSLVLHEEKLSSRESDERKSELLVSSDASDFNVIFAEKLIGRPRPSAIITNNNNETILEEKASNKYNQTVIICMHLGEPGIPEWPDKCRFGDKLLPASGFVNNSDSDSRSTVVHVPFPENGEWYVTMGLFCHGSETSDKSAIIDSLKEFVIDNAHVLSDMLQPCPCSPSSLVCLNDINCAEKMNETEILKIKECIMDFKCSNYYEEMTNKFEEHHKLATEQDFETDNCNASVIFNIASNPCVGGRCGRYGRCYHYMSGGFVFSTCVCMKGYRGWDCTEDSNVPSNMSIILASLLLTLSNLLFIPSVYFAYRRKYYTEAVIYFFAMFFSIFYHACDSGEDEFYFCLVKLGVLQFCDFYCGLLAIWVTLIAMANIRQQFVSLAHMFGAILLAFGTEWDKQSLWVFLAPALTGICIISVSWGWRCRKTRKIFPAKNYWRIYLPIGTVLVMVGLICYAFLQTKQNYYIVHSVWHMVMALSILCLLPNGTTFLPKS